MSTVDYASLQQEVDELLKEFGASAFLRKASASPYDTATGTVTPSAASDIPITCCIVDYENIKNTPAGVVSGSLIPETDRRALISCKNTVVIEIGDMIVWFGRVLSVINPIIVAPAGVSVLYDIQVRQ